MSTTTGRMAIAPTWLLELAVARSPRARPPLPITTRPAEDTLPSVALRIRFAAERLSCGIVPVAEQGNGGHGALLRATVDVVRGYCVPTGDGENNHAFDVLWNYYNPFCLPSWTDDEQHQLIHKLDDAVYKGDKEWAYLLDYRWALEVAIYGGAAGDCSSGCGSVEVDRSDDGQVGGPSGYGADDGGRSTQLVDSNAPKGNGSGSRTSADDKDGHPPGRCLIDHSGPASAVESPQPRKLTTGHTANSLTAMLIGATSAPRAASPAASTPTPTSIPEPKPSSTPVRPTIEQLIARMPSRAIPAAELLELLPSKPRDIAENGPRPGKTPESRAFIVALGCVYIGADMQSTTTLLLSCMGGIAVQDARDPAGYAMQLWLDAWRHRDREIADAIIMIVDKVFFDPNPDPNRTRARSRITFKLRPVATPWTDDYTNQQPWNIPVVLGPPNAGQLSGEWTEAKTACEAGARPGHTVSRGATEAWQDAIVRVVVVEDANGVRKIRHLLPLDPGLGGEIRTALAVCAAFEILARKHSEIIATTTQTTKDTTP